MGYPMAVNLRNKLDKEKAMVICDVNEEAIQRFVSEASTTERQVRVVPSAAEAITLAVSRPHRSRVAVLIIRTP